MSRVRQSVWRSSYVLKTLTLDITGKLFDHLILLLPAMLIGTIDFTFHLIRMKFDVVVEHFNLNNLRLLFSKV